MQQSAFSHQDGSGQQAGAGQQHFYGQQQAGNGANAYGAPHHHTGYGYQQPHHGEQSPNMNYLQTGAHSAHLNMYGYPQQYQQHAHASPHAHYGGQPGFGQGVAGQPQSLMGGNGGPQDYYGHMAQQGMHGYYDPASMMQHHAQSMGMPLGTMPPGSAYAAPGSHQAPATASTAAGKPAKPAKGTGGRKNSASGAAGGAKTKKALKAEAEAAAAAGGYPPLDMSVDSASGKVKTSKAAAGGADRHHPYGGAPVAGGAETKEKAKKKEKERKPPVLKSQLKPPKQAPSAWQVYFTEELQKIKAENPGARLNVAHVAKDAGQRYAALPDEAKKEFQRRSQEAKNQWERDMHDWKSNLTPEDIKQENMFRTAQRKAGKSRKGNLKDPNAPKKPLSAYFLFLRAIRADEKMTQDVFDGEQETTKQSVLAAAKWRSLDEQEKQPYLEKAEADKVEYERLRKQYELTNGLTGHAGGDGKDDEGDEDEGEGSGEYGHYDEATGGVPPSLAAGGSGNEEPFKLEGHFGLGEDAEHLGFPEDKGAFGLEG